MNKEYKIKLDLNKKLYNKKMAFNQFDENVNDFYIEITKNNEVVKDLDKSIITLVAIKPNNTVDAQFIEVKEGQIYADLKPSMCDLVGNYQAKAMIVLEGEIVTTDTINYSVSEDKIISRLNDDVVSDERFPLFTDALSRLSTIEITEEQRMINEAERILSEENRKIEEAKRVEAELVRQHEEVDRTKYDAIRESNENIRKQNESIRLANETNRIDEESKRVEEENKRKLAEEERKANYDFMTEDEERRRSEANAHKEAEVLRVQAETNRVNEEAKRRTTEQARVSAENTRVSNENTREANEVARKNNETQRVEAETQRKNRYNSFIADAEANASNFENYTNNAKIKEEERKASELERKNQETQRVSNENERIANEETRKANEVVREENETSRQNIFENKIDEVDKKIVELNTTKDNFVSSINTKVDNKISELDSAKTDMSNTVSNKIDEVENRFNALTSKQQQDAEVIDARDGETSLKARLDRDIEKAKQVYVNVEGSNISTDSSSGYLKDVEILGNTVQDASNLADIRSVGDKVEGQELYEIPVLSVGKNLWNGVLKDGDIGNDTGLGRPVSGHAIPTDYVKCPSNTNIVISYTVVASSKWFVAYEYDKDKNYLGYTEASKFTTKPNTRYIKFKIENSANIDIKDLMIEVGTQATPYEPYQEDKLTILSPVQLERVGDVADRIICKDGVWGVEKNIDYTIFSGVENWGRSSYNVVDAEGFIIFNCDYLHKKQIKNKGYITDNFVYKSYDGGFRQTSDFEGISDGGGYNLTFVRIRQDRLTSSDVVGFKQWLLENPTLIKYVTKEAQFIPLPHDQQIKLRTFANKTNISFGCEIEGTIKAQVPKSLGATVNTHTEQINNLNKELDRVKKLEESTVSTVTTESDFTTVEATSNGYFEDVKLEGKTLVINANNEEVEPGTEGAILMSVGQDVDEVSVKSVKGDGNLIDIPKHYEKPLKFENYNKFELVTYIRINQDTDYTFTANYSKSNNEDYNGGIGIYLLNSKPKEITKFNLSDISDKVTIHQLELKQQDINKTFNSANYKYFAIYVGTATNSTHDHTAIIDNTKLVKSSISTDFEEFQSNKKTLLYYNPTTQTWEKPILRQWDSIEKHTDGKYYYHQRSGEVVLNGSEEGMWFTSGLNANLTGVQIFILKNFTKNHPYVESNSFNTSKVVSDKFVAIPPIKTTNVSHILNEGVSVFDGNSNELRFSISISKLPTQDIAGFKQWLQANNVTVVYQLAQEKVYECTNIDLITYSGETNYIVNSGAIVPKTTLKVHNNISNVVSLLQKKVSLLESNVTSYMITQNRLMLASRYNADTVSFKVDVATLRNSFEYDNDLYELILNNILVGKDNYNREYIENLIIFYWMDFVISDEMYLTLFEIIEEQHNPKVIDEAPIE